MSDSDSDSHPFCDGQGLGKVIPSWDEVLGVLYCTDRTVLFYCTLPYLPATVGKPYLVPCLFVIPPL
jgi:hypothetical protein